MAKDGYQMFVEETRQQVEIDCPQMNRDERAKEVGRIWSSLTQEQKNEWEEKADAYK